MTALAVVAAVALAIGLAGLVTAPPPAPADARTTPAPATTPRDRPLAPEPLPGRFDPPPALSGRLGVAVLDRSEGRLVLAHRPDAEFTSASLVKLLIALEALERGEPGRRVVTMLARSDDPIASALWTEYGGTGIVTRWAQRLALTATRPAEDPGRWGDTVVTPDDVVRVYEYVLEEAPDRTREVILAGLRSATTYGADGFDQSFGIPDAAAAAGIPRAVKQGWSCCRFGRVLHTTGLLGADARFVVVVLTANPETESWTGAARRLTTLTARILRRTGV
ncbi:hypothetical protein [Prauserella shujinwangii]|uniref:hypothetical protein n=1 Tax=Prauserella shujinwangii TaxID=1453103 RepID=UPI0011B1D26A|nr:hypothetical protein [Prauserella shujinwangii]